VWLTLLCTHSLTHLLTHSGTYFFTHLLLYLILLYSFTYSLPHLHCCVILAWLFTHSLTHSLTTAALLPNRVSLKDLLLYADAAMPEASELEGYAKTVSLTVAQNEDGTPVPHTPAYSLTHPFTHSPTSSLTHPFTHSPTSSLTQGDITAQHLIDFQLSLNRVPPSVYEANLYLSKMVMCMCACVCVYLYVCMRA
jgi:hypothetical protein